jgi:hypothetical protein
MCIWINFTLESGGIVAKISGETVEVAATRN